jgi:alpha-L-fucosidase
MGIPEVQIVVIQAPLPKPTNMNRVGLATIRLLIVTFMLLALTGTLAAQNSRAERYAAYKFGMFITWGPYSVASVEASWPIMKGSWYGRISEEEYRRLPERFNPVKCDPKAWVRLAKQAGQRYMVFTTKHHDGFCMFDSQFTNYKITNTPYQRDVLGAFASSW